MRKALWVLALTSFVTTPAFGVWVEVEPGSPPLSVSVLEPEPGRTVIEYRVGGFDREAVDIAGEIYHVIGLAEESKDLRAGYPELPNVCRSVILPDAGGVQVTVLESSFRDIEGVRVAPSKGNLSRTVNPADVPYTFDPFYRTDGWYPEAVAAHRDPFIFRDFRGAVVVLNPFQFNPSTETLRVYTHVVLRIESVPGPGSNEFDRVRPLGNLVRDFQQIYAEHFVNFQTARYPSVGEEGTMLVICYDSWTSNVQPLVDWKNQMGLETEMVTVTQAGSNATAIKSYISSYYNNPSNDLAYVLLVGDYLECPPPYVGSASDPTYSLLTGSDNYPEIFVGRLSAENTTDLGTQVSRTITYERDPTPGASWYHKGFGIGSAEGPGDDNEYDWEHIDNIRTDLLNYTYTEVDQIYDPGASASQVTVAVNNGRSIGTYCGHGGVTGWSTTGFSNSHVNALVNDNMLPFIFSVACNTGEFDGYTCFGEAWLRATNGSTPTGAIGFYGSTISQSWNPPMDAEDEFADLLVGDVKRTFGGLCYNGSCHMMEQYGSSGENEFLYWTVFGDPSLRVRTDTPATLTVNHDESINPEAEIFAVTVVGVAGARCAVSDEGTYHGHAVTDGSGYCEIPIVGTLPTEGEVTLTVTAYNRIPYIAAVPVATGGPSKPTGLAAEAGDAQVLLTWNPNPEPEVAYYIIFRDLAPHPTDSLDVVAAPDTSYLDLAVTNDSTYYYRIKAVDNEGLPSLYSDEVSATPQQPPVIFITHTPLTDTDDANHPYPVVASITWTEAPLDPDSILVMYETQTRAWESVLMTATGNPDEYRGDIPAQPCGTLVDYYILAVDENHNRETDPNLAPAFTHTFSVNFTVVFEDDFETNLGWTAGVPGDDATTGMWERCDPQGTEAQPEDDHTPAPGVNAYITQCPAGSGQGSYDVDGGKTTLLSPVFDLTECASATISYYRWYSNDTGSEPGTDYWVVEVTDDNWAHWAVLENTNVSNRSWTQMQFDLGTYVDLTDQVQLRFIASDEGGGSLVEAGVDDFRIMGCPSAGAAPTVTVLAPNGGEEVVGGSSTPYMIQWMADDRGASPSGGVLANDRDRAVVTTHILLSTDGGTTYPDTVASGALTSPWAWYAPDTDEPTCRIKIVCVDEALNEGSDVSDGNFEIVSVTHVASRGDRPAQLVLRQNRPNPFNPVTEIEFGLPKTQHVLLEVYSVEGRRVTTLAEGVYPAGYHSAVWHGTDGAGVEVSSGVYFYRLVTDGKVLTHKMLMLK